MDELSIDDVFCDNGLPNVGVGGGSSRSRLTVTAFDIGIFFVKSVNVIFAFRL